MQKHQLITPASAVLILIIILVTTAALASAPAVPFHPDESTQIYMSSDLPVHLTRPGLLAWEPGKENEPRTRYRLLDAPLARLIIGIGQAVSSQHAQLTDWDWSASWAENQAKGALPSPGPLNSARAAVTLLFPITLVLFYAAARRFLPQWAAVGAVLLLAVHPLTLLHARRAMAEGPLLFGICLFLFALTRARLSPWMLGAGMAMAFNAKQSTIFLLVAALLALLMALYRGPQTWLAVLKRFLVFTAVFLTITIALNPVLWKHPLSATQMMFRSRQELLAAQVADFRQIAPQLVLQSPAERVLVFAAQLAIAPPTFAETGNYTAETSPSVEAYQSGVFQGGLPGAPWTGIVLLVLAIFGSISALLDLRSHSPTYRHLELLILAALLQLGGLVFTVPLAFQRYVVPLLPFFCFFSLYGCAKIVWMFQHLKPRASG